MAILGILFDLLLLILIIGFILLVITCHGIIAAIRKIISEIRLYKYYIFRGAVAVFFFELITVVIYQLARQQGLLNKILGTIIFTLISSLYLIFHAGLIGGFLGYLYGKVFGVARPYR